MTKNKCPIRTIGNSNIKKKKINNSFLKEKINNILNPKDKN